MEIYFVLNFFEPSLARQITFILDFYPSTRVSGVELFFFTSTYFIPYFCYPILFSSSSTLGFFSSFSLKSIISSRRLKYWMRAGLKYSIMSANSFYMILFESPFAFMMLSFIFINNKSVSFIDFMLLVSIR